MLRPIYNMLKLILSGSADLQVLLLVYSAPGILHGFLANKPLHTFSEGKVSMAILVLMLMDLAATTVMAVYYTYFHAFESVEEFLYLRQHAGMAALLFCMLGTLVLVSVTEAVSARRKR